MNLTEQLARDGNLLSRPVKSGPKPKRPLKRKVRVKRVSAKRAKEGRIYAQKRKAFLEAHPLCMAWTIITAHICKPGVKVAMSWIIHMPLLCPPSEEIHHMRKPKCKYLNDENTWLAVSRWSHEFIELHKDIARTLGLLA